MKCSTRRIEGIETLNIRLMLLPLQAHKFPMKFEEKGGIVLCMGLRKNKPVSATIATRSNFNLNRVYEELRKNRGVRAGGRDRIGGIQFKLDFSPDEALNIVQRAVECVLNA